MKYIKLAVFLLAACLVASCDKTPTFEGGASIGFESDTIRFTYGNFTNNIPLVFNGESNIFPISVKLELASDYDGDGYNAIPDVDYIITSTDMFFGRPEDYDKTLEEEGNVTISKNIEVSYPSDTIPEIRFKLRISEISVDEVDGLGDEIVVIVAQSDLQRLSGNYVISGDLYNMSVNGGDTTFVSAGRQASYDIVIEPNADNTALKVRGLFNTEQDWLSDTTLTNTRITSFSIKAEQVEVGEYEKERWNLSLPLGYENNNYSYVSRKYTGFTIVTEDNQLIEGPISVTYDSNYVPYFDHAFHDNLITFRYFNSAAEFEGYYGFNTFLKNAVLTKVE